MCGISSIGTRTCPSLPNEDTRPSDLDVNALLSIYGNDGFGAYNRVLGSEVLLC
jgi:hypothetical protein